MSAKKENTLLLKKENVWEKYLMEKGERCTAFCEEYKEFLDACKTERQATSTILALLKEKGFKDLDKPTGKNGKAAGFYRILHNKALMIFVNGKNKIEQGLRIVGAHIDAPRIDLKPNPLYEESSLSFFKTHYYGGIKKYQWTSIPLAVHGVFVKQNGELVEVKVGESPEDPVFTITDLLPHLAQDQMQKKLAEGIMGEDLNLLVGSIPDLSEKEAKEKIKMNVLKLLHESYGICEEDFVSSELEIVPAWKARDVGFDRSMIGAYGQDDRVCAYTALMALLHVKSPKMPAVCYLSDKEEIGSVGNTGAASKAFEYFISDIAAHLGYENPESVARKCLNHSQMISADVNAGYDPTFAGVYEKNNASYLGRGVVMTKYTGARGKAGASDANAEYVAKIRDIFNRSGIIWQAAELGKVDQGGGGTIALYFANLGIDVIDAGVAVLSMHGPFEITNKMDIYLTYEAFKAFYED